MTQFKHITKGLYCASLILEENFHVDVHDIYWFGEKNNCSFNGFQLTMNMNEYKCLNIFICLIFSCIKKLMPRHEHAASKAWASTQQPRPGRACSSQGLGVLAWARWHAPGRAGMPLGAGSRAPGGMQGA